MNRKKGRTALAKFRRKFSKSINRWTLAAVKRLPFLKGPTALPEDDEDDEDEDYEIGVEPGQLPIEAPFENLETAQFRVIRYDDLGYSLEEFSDIDKLSSYVEKNDGVVWVQMMGMKDPQLIHVVGALFNIPTLTQEDILSVWSRPKYDEPEDDLILAITRAVRLSVEEMQPKGQQISFVAGKGFLVSFHEKRELIFENIERRIAENSGKIRHWGSAYLLYTLIDALVDRVLRLSEEIEDAISDLEDDTVREDSDGDSDGEDIRRIYRLKRIVVRMGRMVYPLRDLVRRFRRYTKQDFPEEMEEYFSDLADHTERAFDRMEHSRAILQELQDFYHSEHERRTSEIIRILTVVTAIFIPLTFIVGVYGMNFKYMPELETRYGYFALLAIMAIAAAGTFVFFRRKKWI